MNEPKPPKKPENYYFKEKTKIVIDYNLLYKIFILTSISIISYCIIRIMMLSQPNTFIHIIIGLIGVPTVGLIIYTPFLFFSLFSREKIKIKTLKSKREIEFEHNHYQFELSEYARKLEEFNKIKKQKIKKSLDETEKRDQIRRQLEAKKRNLEETDRKDQIRRQKENELKKQILKNSQDVTENLASSTPAIKESVENKDLIINEEPPPWSLEDLADESNYIDFENEEIIDLNLEVFQSRNYSNKIFIESSTSIPYKWYALWHYYPVNRFPNESLSSQDLTNRNQTFEFKDGTNPEKFAKLLSEAMKKEFGESVLKNKTLLIVPASNKTKTERRFELFCTKLSAYTGIKNGYEFLSNNNIERVPVHQGGNRNLGIASFIKLNFSVLNKELIIIDDVRTSGKSSNDVYQLLKANGAKSIIFIYFGKTFSSSTFTTHSSQTSSDDLPF
jgi:phosphoribosylpyrophosphate synthetase